MTFSQLAKTFSPAIVITDSIKIQKYISIAEGIASCWLNCKLGQTLRGKFSLRRGVLCEFPRSRWWRDNERCMKIGGNWAEGSTMTQRGVPGQVSQRVERIS